MPLIINKILQNAFITSIRIHPYPDIYRYSSQWVDACRWVRAS